MTGSVSSSPRLPAAKSILDGHAEKVCAILVMSGISRQAICDHRSHGQGVDFGNGTRIAFHLFQNLSNFDQRLRNPGRMLGSASPPFLTVTEGCALPPDRGWNAMTDYPAAIPLLGIHRLRCPNCRTRMKPAQISPGPTGFELRTYDCANCAHVEKIVIALDPMKSGDVGWLVSEVQPPG
jgi:hypothetical protein